MEMWLRQNEDKFRFPVFPPSFILDGKAIIDNTSIVKLGELNIFGGTSLKSIEISSMFPNKQYTFCEYKDFPKPYDCVNKIERWMNEGFILRFTITETNINLEVIIDSFKYGEKDGTRDVYFTLQLKEYKRFKINKIEEKSNETNQQETTRPNKNDTANNKENKQKTHKVVPGDCLYSLARKYYGNGNLYMKIFEANRDKIKIPDLIYDGDILIIP